MLLNDRVHNMIYGLGRCVQVDGGEGFKGLDGKCICPPIEAGFGRHFDLSLKSRPFALHSSRRDGFIHLSLLDPYPPLIPSSFLERSLLILLK